MAVQQTECYRVVTIGYLKSFIGDLIQNSSNGSAIHISRTDDTYCPTYSELTGGTIVQTWKPGSTPYSDRDGIVVNSSAILGGNYAENQCVDQRDLSLMYTRFNSLSIARSGSGNMDACQDDATLTYTYNYNRYTKAMNNSCTTATSESTVNSSCGELEYHTTFQNLPNSGSSVTNCTSYHIGKNGSVKTDSRDDYVYADVTFRSTTYNSNVIKITQNGLTGNWLLTATTYDVYAWRVTPTDGVVRACTGDRLEYKAKGEGYTYKSYIWKDECDVEYPGVISATTETEPLGEKSGWFSSWDCCDGGYTDSASISFEWGDAERYVTFSQECADCSSSSSCQPPTPSEDCHVSSSAPKVLSYTGGTVTYIFKHDN